MNRVYFRTAKFVPVALIAAACATDTTVAPTTSASAPQAASAAATAVVSSEATTSWVIDLNGSSVPATLAADVAAAGGTVTSALEGAGLAIAESSDPSFGARAKKIAGVRLVTQDRMVQWTAPNARDVDGVDAMDASIGAGATEQAAAIGSAETFRAIQWNVDAISAPAAWAAGYQGKGARVAVIDGGIYSSHIDVAPNLDVAHSRSFVPGQAWNNDVGTFWHATHVAGIIAAPANNIGTVGVAPQATVIGVKALHNGSGAFSWIINAIYYAATPIAEGGAGANIINMSLGAGFKTSDEGAAQLKNAISKATTYAYQHGVTVIVAAGNDTTDIDHTANLIFVPAQAAHVITVAATGPVGFALGAANYDHPSSYTNFGQSAITLAAPGGDDFSFNTLGTQICSYKRFPTGSSLQYCYALDMVIAPCRSSGASVSGYCWADGTSMAAPAVAGVAALIVGKNGPMDPSHVETILRQSADDLGKPGNDDYYGRGRINAARAVM
jgi:subtilisin family serine protease